MTKQEIIEQLFDNGYCLNPSTRALDGGFCSYYLTDGRMCAVGKCMTSPKDFEGNLMAVEGLEDLEGSLKPEYRGHSLEFWSNLQVMHDSPQHWNDTGLTEIGAKRFNELKLKYSE